VRALSLPSLRNAAISAIGSENPSAIVSPLIRGSAWGDSSLAAQSKARSMRLARLPQLRTPTKQYQTSCANAPG
jgi:hypothetical protein